MASGDWRKTSANGIVDEQSAVPPFALLGDFDIEGSALKANHRRWLDQAVVEPIKAFAGPRARISWNVQLTGAASQSGDPAFNRNLSIKRIDSVRHYLMAGLAGEPVHFHPVPVGESRPKVAGAEENWADRAVEVLVTLHRGARPRRLPLIVKPGFNRPRRDKTGEFMLRVVSGKLEVIAQPELPVLKKPEWVEALPKGLIGKLDLLLEIHEVGTPHVANYRFAGRGPGSFFGQIADEFRYPGGKGHRFKAPSILMEVDDFAGAAAVQKHIASGRVFRFGPRRNVFVPPSIRIDGIDFGREFATFDLSVGVEYMTLGEITLVT